MLRFAKNTCGIHSSVKGFLDKIDDIKILLLILLYNFNFQGRYFFGCDKPRNQQCGFFQWADETTKDSQSAAQPGKEGGARISAGPMKLNNIQSITTYLRGKHIAFYCENQLVEKSADFYKDHRKMPVNIQEFYLSSLYPTLNNMN